jgi:CheY-like chemotaxis protein
MIYGFAKQSGGHASVYSEEGRGTTVNLYLPRYVLPAEASDAPARADPVEPGAGQLILAVEDDERVRRLTVSRLQQLGYRVLQAASGAEALETIAAHPDIDLLFTDLIMPGGLSGYDLSARVRNLYPRIRILLTSGYAEELVNSDRPPGEQFRVLRKPYRQADLARAIEDALER